MAIFSIRKFNDPILRKKAKKVLSVNKKTKKFIASLAQTMIKKGGVGLAAPQVGKGIMIIVVDLTFLGQKILALINPRIIEKSGKTNIGEEGCLSFPGIYLKIKRADSIEVEYTNIKGETKKLKANGFLARILQHEIDHLNGVLFFHRLSLIGKIKFKAKHPMIKF